MLDLRNRLYISTFQDNCIAVARKYGLGLEFNHTCISEDLDENNRATLLRRMSDDLAASGSKGSIVHGPFTEIHPAAIDYRARKLSRDRLEEAFQVCQELNVNKMSLLC